MCWWTRKPNDGQFRCTVKINRKWWWIEGCQKWWETTEQKKRHTLTVMKWNWMNTIKVSLIPWTFSECFFSTTQFFAICTFFWFAVSSLLSMFCMLSLGYSSNATEWKLHSTLLSNASECYCQHFISQTWIFVYFIWISPLTWSKTIRKLGYYLVISSILLGFFAVGLEIEDMFQYYSNVRAFVANMTLELFLRITLELFVQIIQAQAS